MELLETINLQKTVQNGDTQENILKGIQLSFQKGKITALIGASGSGKSTFLTILAGLQSVSSGEVLLEGNSLVAMSAEQLRKLRAKEFGYVFQYAHLVPFLTVEEQLHLMLDIAASPLSKQERKQEVHDVLGMIDMLHRQHAYPSILSGGEKQRVAIARAVIHKPKLLFADEPTASLDSKRSMDIMELILKLTKKNDITTLMVTHDEDMLRYADRVIKMNDGKITEDRTV
ncbi:putative ABC transport system ATP-binding protein [Terribacillus halophilus]|uniref:Putative ABC transport system ATP-binding protein n=1 Tax=Terribacillus halophilus TaxID=361279 RepID=A0A1G6I1W4_9BACI|nr:ABC transporter ATP-binding protein [Terribacillus halophilus]SDC00474.1 putative ABC transport system ATP-binding protein [Terribacillus halophilus]